MSRRTRTLTSPIGSLRITAGNGAIIGLDWCDSAEISGDADPLLAAAVHQLEAYFAGTQRAFDLPLAPAGSAHDRRVWRAMLAIPFGTTRSYGEIAAAIGSSARAVGAACGRNPIPVIIPCHRVLAAGGRLGGYSGAGGSGTKRRLLALEGAMLAV
jgi:methylated-DNA-[protein]-cysteine S-methyltransferase